MTDINNCEFIKLIKVLLPCKNGRGACNFSGCGSFVMKSCIILFFLLLLQKSVCALQADGFSTESGTQGGTTITDSSDTSAATSSTSSESGGGGDRAEKVKAKWKGESFWVKSVANLTLLESQKTKEVLSSTPPTFTSTQSSHSSGGDGAISSSRKISSIPPSPTQSTFNLPPPNPSHFPITETSDPDLVTPPTSTKKMRKGIKFKSKKHKRAKTSTSTYFNLNQKMKPTKSPHKKIPRTTLTADLSHYGQEYYLEYESNEEDTPSATTPTEKPKKTRTKPLKRNKTKLTFGYPRTKKVNSTSESVSKNPPNSPEEEEDDLDSTQFLADLSAYGQNVFLEYDSQEELGNQSNETLTKNGTENGTLAIQFYPKTPVNLMDVLQALASQMQPIKMASTVGGAAPSIPLQYNVNITNRVPVRLHPPTSPFLFSMDLDSFFTRMAISVFYSGIAIAPLIYIMMGGLGSLRGLSTLAVPLTGKKKRRRRRSTINSKFLDTEFDSVLKSMSKFLEQFEDKVS